MENADNVSRDNDDNTSLIQDGKNKFPVVCIRCPSKILNTGVGEYKVIEFPLPQIKRSADKHDGLDDNVKQYWLVRDKFSFENIGFTNTVSGLKYLTCADCELGPLGWYDPDLNFSYLALARVKHVI